MKRLLGVLSLLTACAASGGGDGASGPALVGPDEVAEDGTVLVAHERELRGAWISTVYNGVWPSSTGLDMATSRAELVDILDKLASARMNAVFFQVRPESDAVYASALEPWSRFLTGLQGGDPGWDPLSFAIEEGHRRGIEVHAWLNPYRGLTTTSVVAARNHVTRTMADATRTYANYRWMDPGAPQVRAHILEVIRDIVSRYDVDGIHFDDYFYPYPVAGQTFDDDATYGAYTAGGGTLGREDWRRSNVDTLIRETSALVASARPDVRFGVSPFGIYRPGQPEGIVGLDAWASLYCDPVRWMNEGWVDYLAPQLYWPSTQAPQAFGKLVTWWSALASNGRSIFVGHNGEKAGAAGFPLSEFDVQMDLTRAERPRARGSIYFSAKSLISDQAGLRTNLATRWWTTPALTPPLASAKSLAPPAPPKVDVAGAELLVAAPPRSRAIAVYRRAEETGRFALERVVPVATADASKAKLPAAPGVWAVSVVDRAGLESRGVVAEVR